ncbi:MAG TPA: methionine adenosyltransferase [Candidatus Saccharimonadales bacterium]|jgi:S-adenosylmethionine synthetase|nr:methionine adenosyltransferase [Candidatus Saccharimonadales bacterium]
MSQYTSQNFQFASESVCAGHPDKVCDQISDAIVDAVLAQDPNGRTAVEVLASANQLTLAGEVTTRAVVDFEAVAREQIRRLGYTNPDWGFHDGCEIKNFIHQQSPEIAVGVDADGAGDQGMMFGFATRETPELMPMPIALAHALTRAIDTARETKLIPYLRPDGKAQVVVKYVDGKPQSVSHVTIAVPHAEDIMLMQVKTDLLAQIVQPILSQYGFEVGEENLIVNGTGVWYVPGPYSDAGLTGRKIVVDGYGGFARVGGGAFSGKDPSKVDRSGAYAARYIAKNIVANNLADTCEVSVAYYIGALEPVMVNIETFGTNRKPQADLEAYAQTLLTPSVKGIIETLDLRRPTYLPTAAYGHFGRPEFPWEQIVSS